MVSESLKRALEELKSERDRLTEAIDGLEDLVAGKGRGKGQSGRRRGRPRQVAAKRRAAASGGAASPRAPRGLLLKKIRSVLSKAKEPMAPVELRNRVIRAGYPVKDAKVLYTMLFSVARKDPDVKKTKAGFSLESKGAARRPARPPAKKGV